MFTFSNDYLLKSIRELVQDETKRVLSLGLASSNDVEKLANHRLKGVTEESAFLAALGALHADLRTVYLPGDFEKLAITFEELEEFVDNPEESEKEEEISEELEKAKEGFREEVKEEAKQEEAAECEKCAGRGFTMNPEVARLGPAADWYVDCPECGGTKKSRSRMASLSKICTALADEAYHMGRVGDHDGAYRVERLIGVIQSKAALLDDNDIKDLRELVSLAEDEPEEEAK